MMWWRQAIDVLLNGPPDPVVAPAVIHRGAWQLEERQDVRCAAAMSMLDEDVCGFFLLTFHRNESESHIAVSHVVDADWWEPIAAAVTQVRADLG